jgi:hypothetical protein
MLPFILIFGVVGLMLCIVGLVRDVRASDHGGRPDPPPKERQDP